MITEKKESPNLPSSAKPPFSAKKPKPQIRIFFFQKGSSHKIYITSFLKKKSPLNKQGNVPECGPPNENFQKDHKEITIG